MSHSLSQVVLHLLSKHGPQTSKQLLSHITESQQLSHKYLKVKVLRNMKRDELIQIKPVNDPERKKSPKSRPLFLWYINEDKVNKDAHMKLHPESSRYLYNDRDLTVIREISKS